MKNKHVLLIEPDHVLAKTTTQFLRKASYRVTHFADAQSAVAHADDDRPDIVVLELSLAAHSGVEFIYEFRSYPDWADVPIIILSSMAGDESINDESYKRKFHITDVLKKSDTTLQRLERSVATSLRTSANNAAKV